MKYSARENSMRIVLFVQDKLRHGKPTLLDVMDAVRARFEVSTATAYRMANDAAAALCVSLPAHAENEEKKSKRLTALRRAWEIRKGEKHAT